MFMSGLRKGRCVAPRLSACVAQLPCGNERKGSKRDRARRRHSLRVPLPHHIISRVPTGNSGRPQPRAQRSTGQQEPQAHKQATRASGAEDLRKGQGQRAQAKGRTQPHTSPHKLQPPMQRRRTHAARRKRGRRVPPLKVPLARAPPTSTVSRRLLHHGHKKDTALRDRAVHARPARHVEGEQLAPILGSKTYTTGFNRRSSSSTNFPRQFSYIHNFTRLMSSHTNQRSRHSDRFLNVPIRSLFRFRCPATFIVQIIRCTNSTMRIRTSQLNTISTRTRRSFISRRNKDLMYPMFKRDTNYRMRNFASIFRRRNTNN